MARVELSAKIIFSHCYRNNIYNLRTLHMPALGSLSHTVRGIGNTVKIVYKDRRFTNSFFGIVKVDSCMSTVHIFKLVRCELWETLDSAHTINTQQGGFPLCR